MAAEARRHEAMDSDSRAEIIGALIDVLRLTLTKSLTTSRKIAKDKLRFTKGLKRLGDISSNYYVFITCGFSGW